MRGAWTMLLLLLPAACQSDAAPAPAATSSASALPATSVSAKAPAALTQARVDEFIAAQTSALRERCVKPAQKAPIELSLIAEIAPDGTVKDVAVAGGGADLRPIRGCVETVVRTWTFGPSKGGEVTGTLTLKP